MAKEEVVGSVLGGEREIEPLLVSNSVGESRSESKI